MSERKIHYAAGLGDVACNRAGKNPLLTADRSKVTCWFCRDWLDWHRRLSSHGA